MSADVVLLVATAVLALVALVAATIAVLAVRRLARAQEAQSPEAQSPEAQSPEPRPQSQPGTLVVRANEPLHAEVAATPPELASRSEELAPRSEELARGSEELAPRLVHGRVVVPPTGEQVVATAMSRPQVRLSILTYGLARALRPESRDRISALMRREYRSRRRQRLAAGRRAVRAAHPSAPADRWLGETGDA